MAINREYDPEEEMDELVVMEHNGQLFYSCFVHADISTGLSLLSEEPTADLPAADDCQLVFRVGLCLQLVGVPARDSI